MHRFTKLAALLLTSASLFACSSVGEGKLGSQSGDVAEGGACQFSGPGNAKYKDAVAAAKDRGREECSVLQTDTILLAQEAVGLCPAVGALIAESEFAGALRASIGPLELAYLAGDLDGEGDALNSDAVVEALDGQSLWAPGQGAYGPPRIVRLGDGVYELERLVSEDDGETIERRLTSRGDWIGSSVEGGGFEITFEPDEGEGPEEQLGSFRIERWNGWEGLQLFRFVPADGSLDEYGTNALYAANISECEA